MRYVGLLIATLALALQGCERTYVVVTVEDPDGLAAGATALRVGPKGSLSTRELPGGLPETYAARGEAGSVTVQEAEALDARGAVLARGRARFAFPRSGSSDAQIELRAICASDADCDDGRFANGLEVCDEGICAAGEPCPASPIACVDVVPDEAALQCVPTPVHERCDPVEGPGGALESTYCDTRLGCVLGDACAPEDEGALCPRTEPCAPDLVCLSGRCIAGAPIAIDDDNPCTLDVCDAQAGPVNIPDPTARGNACPLDDTGALGVCLDGVCAASRCGDGFVDLDAGEACDDGAANSDVEPNACRTSCARPSCGDGVADQGEACDDGNADEGDACRSSCVANVCGDGVRNPAAEECDDGDGDPLDSCRPDCRTNVCGDGFLNLGVEACDDGNRESADGCSEDCDFVVWSASLPGAPVGGPVAWFIDEEVELPAGDAGPDAGGDAGVETVVVSRALVGAVTVDGVFVAYEQDTGAERWRYDAQAVIRARPSVGARAVVLLAAEGTVHVIPTDGDPAGVRTISLATTSDARGLGVGAGGSTDLIVAVDDDGTVYDLRSDGTASDFNGRPLGPAGPYPHATTAGVACEACVPTITNGNFNDASNMGILVPLGDELWWWNLRGACPPEQLNLGAGERILSQVIFPGNGGSSLDNRDAFFAATNQGRVLKATIDNNFGTVCGVPPTIVYAHQSPSAISAPPAVVPATLVEPDAIGFDGFVYYTAVDGRLERLRPDGARSGPPWPYVAGAALLHTPTVDAELTVYAGDADGTLHAVQGQTAALRWSLDLGAPLSGSPLVAGGLVFAATTDGRLLAIERGGEPLQATASWAREGRNNRSSGQSTDCSQLNASPVFWAFGALLLALRRRRA